MSLILKTVTRKLSSHSAQTTARGRIVQPDLIWDCSDLLGPQNWVGVLRRTGSHNNCGLLSFPIGLKILWEQLSRHFHIPGLKLSTFFLMNTLFVDLVTLFPESEILWNFLIPSPHTLSPISYLQAVSLRKRHSVCKNVWWVACWECLSFKLFSKYSLRPVRSASSALAHPTGHCKASAAPKPEKRGLQGSLKGPHHQPGVQTPPAWDIPVLVPNSCLNSPPLVHVSTYFPASLRKDLAKIFKTRLNCAALPDTGLQDYLLLKVISHVLKPTAPPQSSAPRALLDEN